MAAAPPFGEMARPADRTCDAALSKARLIEDEAAAEVVVVEEEEEPPPMLTRVGDSALWIAKLKAEEDEGELKWRVGERDL
jgi:hypothetical protein